MLTCAVAMAQNNPAVYVNVPSVVCISTAASSAGQDKFLSVNAMINAGNGYTQAGQPTWTITTPNNDAAEYEVLYTGNAGAVIKADKLKTTKSLTLQFLEPGVYTVQIEIPYKYNNGSTKTTIITRTITAMDCTINTCGSNEANDKPGFFEDFGSLPGSGIVRRPYPINGVVTYDYQGTNDLKDNYYSISNNTQLKGDWVNSTDHTGNDRGGMLVANSHNDPRQLYKKTVSGLCKGSVYNFSAWLMNINPRDVFENGCVSGYKYAGVTFKVVNADNPSQVLATFPTYNVSMHLGAPKGMWERFGGSFMIPSNVENVIVTIFNDMPGGCGNDIAIDDIEFAYCSPNITASIKGKTGNLAEVVCEGAPITLTSDFTPADYFTNPRYQWEMSDDEGLTYVNVPFGTSTSKELVIGPGELKGTRTVPTSYRFRVRIYEDGSDAVTCASPSEYVRLTILPMPTLYLTKSQVCAGAFVELQASGGFDRFTWRDLPGYEGATRTIQVTGDTTIMVYGFVDYADGHTCKDSNTAHISSVDNPIVDVISTSQNICAGSSVDIRINDVLAGFNITWFQGPDAGGVLTPLPQHTGKTFLSQVQINTPAQGVFTVVVKDPLNVCEVKSAPFIVNVTPVPIANAGPDQLACASINTTGLFTMAATLNAAESGTWIVDSVFGPGVTVPITAADFKDYATVQFPTLRNSRVTLKKAGITARFKWTVKSTVNNACSSSDFVEVSLLFDPSNSDAGRDTTLCGTNNVFTMDASQPDLTLTGPSAEIGTWTLVSGNATIADIHAYNTTVTSLVNEQDIVLSWTITNAANCTPTTDIVVLHKTTRPVINLRPGIITCNSNGTFQLDTLSTKGNPDTYSITAGTPALPGFVAITDQPITAWPITINYPVGTPRGVYNFNLSYRNSANAGCDSTVPFSVGVQTPPTAPTGVAAGTPNICTSGTTNLSVVGGSLGQNADGTPNGNWVWYAGGCGVGTPIGTGASITVSVSATTTYYVRAEPTGACTNTTCASTTVTVFQAPNPADAGLDQTKCNTASFTMAANAASVGTGTWTVTAPGAITAGQQNSPTATITVPAGNSVVATWTINNGACTTSDAVSLTNYSLPTANAGVDIRQCNNSTFTMASTITGTGTGKWTVAVGSVATIPTTDSTKTNAVITVPVGTSASLVWTVTNGKCTTSDIVVLTNYSQPTANAGVDIRQCNNSTFNMAATITGTGTGKWTVVSGAATIPTTDSTKTNAVITVAVGTTATLAWTVTNGVCTHTDNVVLTNYAQPTANAGVDIKQCNNSTFNMAATITGTGTGKWTVVSGAATIPTTDSTKTNAVITVAVGTTATLAWTVTNGVCTHTDNVVLTNYAQPTANAGIDIRQCNNSTFNMAATITGTGTGKWTVVSGAATIPTTDSTKTNAVITVAVGNTATLAWTVTNGVCTHTDNVVLTNYAQPTANAGVDIRQCNNSTFNMAATITGTGTGKWTVAAGTAAIPTTDSTNANAVITVAVGTSATLVWTVTNGVCTHTDNVVLTNYSQPTANAGVDIRQCNNSTFNMAATITGTGTGKWTVVSGTATIPTTDSTKTNAAITVAVGNTATLAWTVTNGVCTHTDNVVLTNDALPTANAGIDIRQCNNSTFTMASTITGTGTGKWTVVSGTATIPTTDSTKTNAVITVAVGTTATLAWTVTNGVCTHTDNVVLTNYSQPTANAGVDIRQCNNSTFNMAATITGTGTGKWTVVTGAATIPTTDSTKTNAVITVAAGTSATLVWTVTNGVCTHSDNVVLTNDAQPTANAGIDIRQCNISTFTMAATITGTGTGKWTVASGTATIPTTDSTKTNAVITVAVGTSATLVWTVTNGVCTHSDNVVLTNDALPTANAGPDQENCNDASFPMAATITGTGTGKWTLVPGTTASFAVTDSTNANAVINVPAGVTARAVWHVSNGSCFVTDTVVLTNYVAPAPSNAGPDQEKCNIATFTMDAQSATAGVGKWKLVAGTTASFAVTDSTNRNAVINVPAGVSVEAVWIIQNGTCVTTDTVKLTNYEAPADANAGSDQEDCNNTSTFTLTANTPSVAGATGTWSVVSPAGFTFPAGQINNPTASITVPVGTVLTLKWTITNGLCTTNDDVVLTNYAEPDIADAGPAQSKCAGTDFVTAANTPTVPGAVGTWTVVAGTATIKTGEEHLPIAHITVPNGASATLRWTIKNGLCENFSDVDLTNFLTPSPANAGPDQRDCNIPTFTMSANAPDVPSATGTWRLAAGSPGSITPGDENKPDAVINVPTGATVTAIWTITNGTCPSEDTVLLTNDEMPSLAVAGPDQENCNHPAFTMAANAPSVGVGKWSLTPGTTASFAVADSSNINAIINVPAGVTVTATWTITNGTCVTSDDVVLTNYVAPAPSNAGPDQEKCNTPTFTMAAAAPSVGVGKWRLVPGSTASFAVTDSTNRTAVINVPVGESVEAIWAITNGVCTTEDTVRLTNYVAPAPAAAGPDQEQCNTPAFTMAANTPSVGVGKWSLPAGSTASFPVTDSTNPNVIITVPAGVTVTATWTITNGVCTTSDNVVLTNNEQPTQADAGPDQEQCNTPAFRMAANRPSVGVGKWSLSAGTTASFAVADSTNPNAVITVPVGVTVTATWTIRNGNCVTFDDVVLTNYEEPAKANAGGDMTHCDNDRFVMAANTPSVGTGIWSLPAGTTASIAAADWNNPNAVITVPAGVVVTATWTITNGTCTTSDNVILTNHEMPSNAAAGLDQTHCDDPNFTMSANVPSPATAAGTWTIISGAAIIADIHSPSTRVTVSSGGTVTLRWTITNGTCTSTPDDVVLTNQAAILGNTITADQLLCANETPAMLQGATLSGGNGTFTYQWQVSTTSATTGFANVTVNGTNATFNPPMITQNTWYRRVVMSGACTGNISNAVMLTLMNIPPVVISVPGPLTVDCVQGTDYTTKFGTPVFSHAPYNNEPLTVTHNDVTTTVDACTFTIQRTWTAMDRCGLTTQAQQTITVIDRTAPVFTATAPANVTVDCDKVPAAVNLPANDACTGVLNIVPIEVRVDQPGACASNYQLIRKWVAVDACGNASDTLRQVITVRDMTPPVFNNPAPTNITVDCDKVPAGQPLTANDNCTPGVITAIPVDVRKNLSGSRCADNYQIIRTWTATDLCGNKTVLTQTITVQDTIKPRFSMSLPPAITVDCDKVPTVAAITATDNCTVSVAVKVSEKKEFLSTVCTSNYRLTRTWTAIDNCGNTATMQQVITVQDTTRPVFVVMPPADTTVSCDAIPTPPTNLSARDNCSTVKISYTQTRETIPGACASNYRLIRIWTAKDQCNNTNTIRQVITVTDTTKPVIDPAPANVTLNCGEAVPAAATLYARDNCDATFPKKATMTQDPFVVDLCAGYTIIRRWRIADACGNQAIERVQTITVNPCPKPALDPNLPANCSNNTRFAIMLQNKVSKPKFTLVSVVPASAVRTPLTQSSNVFDLNGATQATFIVTDGVTGCVSDPITYDLQYVMKPVVDLGADVAICQGSSVTLDAGIDNAAYTIRWSTGASTQTIDVTTAGNYTVTVSNGICTTTDAINVTVNMPPVVNIPDTAICMGEVVTLKAYVQGATYVWSTSETTASIDVTTSGTYSVDVTLNGCTTHEEATVTVGTPPVITLTDDSEICPDETLMLTVDPDGGNVRWSTGETTNSIVVTKAGNYEVTVTRDGCKVTDMVAVTERPDLDIDLGPDREFCTGGRVVVDATHPDAISYLWNDGETTPIREIVMPGKYVVSVMDRFCSRITMDSVNVTVAGIPETLLPADTTLCIGEDLTLKVNAGIGNSIRWQDGSSGATYKVTGPGTYTVTVSNECGSVTDNIVVRYQPCEPKPQFPTGFTPNGDGHNDIFKPVVRGPMYDYDLRIYNRWGELIFLSKDQKNGWDGRYKGALVENGTYVWMLSYKKVLGGAVNIVKGEVTAIR